MNEDDRKELELEVRRLFSADTGQYRQYLEAQFSQLKWALGVILVVVTGVIVYFSGKSYSDLKSLAETQISDRVVDLVVNDSARKRLDERVTATIQDERTRALIAKLVEPQVAPLVVAEITNRLGAAQDERMRAMVTKLVEAQLSSLITAKFGEGLNTAVEEKLKGWQTNDWSRGLLPRGVILPWNGRGTTPAGWAICDGANGTPDLRGRFLMGTADAKEIGAIGGAVSHQHTVVKARNLLDGNGFQGEGNRCMVPKTDFAENLPPYFKVIYIIKL